MVRADPAKLSENILADHRGIGSQDLNDFCVCHDSHPCLRIGQPAGEMPAFPRRFPGRTRPELPARKTDRPVSEKTMFEPGVPDAPHDFVTCPGSGHWRRDFHIL